MNPVQLTPIHSDELLLKGETYDIPMRFDYLKGTERKGVDLFVQVYVPRIVRQADDLLGVEHLTMVFFTAGLGRGSEDLNDLLTHGLRAPADAKGYVLIVVPGLEAGQISSEPTLNFCAFSDAKISECFKAVELRRPALLTCLAAHSRGHRGLTRTLMGNANLGHLEAIIEKQKDSITIKSAAVNMTNVKRIAYLDNFYLECEMVMEKLIDKGLGADVLLGYKLQAFVNYEKDKNKPVRTEPKAKLFKNKSEQWIDLQTPVGLLQASAIGCLRLIRSTVDVENTTGGGQHRLADKLSHDGRIFKIEQNKHQPVRGAFTTRVRIPPGMISYIDYSKRNRFTPTDEMLLRDFVNNEKLSRLQDETFDQGISAHHFFVADIVHELFI